MEKDKVRRPSHKKIEGAAHGLARNGQPIIFNQIKNPGVGADRP
jgi:hypothetical protein